MTVPARLVAAFVAVVVVLVVPTGYAMVRLGDLQSLAVAERGQHATAASAIGRMEASLARLDLRLRSYLSQPSAALEADVYGALAELRADVDRLDAAGYNRAAEILATPIDALEATVAEIEGLAGAGRLDDATDAFAAVQPLVSAVGEELTRAAETVDRQAQADFARAEAISASARTGTLLALAVGLFVAGLVGIWATGALVTPLRRLSRATAEVADGRLEAPGDLPYDRDDEIGDLSRSFRAMTLRLAELDRLKAEFVGVASHELKTPINVIRGYTELIEEELSGEVTESQEEVLHAIAEQCRSMSRMVSRLMDISRLETGSYELELETLHVADVLTGLVRAFDILAEQEGIELKTRVQEGTPETFVADMDIVRDEILGNLVTNALKFTPRGGEVRVTARREDGHVVFRVADTGPGIPKEHREHVFDKYHQVERSRKVGSGLGLALAREMAQAHGGTIDLVPARDQGAVFDVTLPLAPDGASDPASGAPESSIAVAD